MKQTKQTTPITFAELVDETVTYYSNNPRSSVRAEDVMSGSVCKYAGPNGERCAAARLCDESATDLEAMDTYHEADWPDVYHLAALKPEYAHFTVRQVSALQKLHDRNMYWLDPFGDRSAKGLTDKGEQFVKEIKANYQTPTP